MKISSISILSVFLSSYFSFSYLNPIQVFGFQTELPGQSKEFSGPSDPFKKLEAGLASHSSVSDSFVFLGNGEYQKALEQLTPEDQRRYSWLRPYLKGLIEVSSSLVRYESDHFILFVPPQQTFLVDYALPSLEQTAEHVEKVFGHRPKEKIRVEIYPTKKDFSRASTLDEETLKRSGAIGICKFHRLMILSPQGLPLGYRWMDALSHEYMHLIINELSWSQAELWLHEGTARYFDTSYRSDPPAFLSPHQKTKLIEALEEEKIISFKRMSPSLVYLKDQEEVSLAFSQVSHAVEYLIKEKGTKKFVKFLKMMRKAPFQKSFSKSYGMNTVEFEEALKKRLSEENWTKTKGTMSDDIQFDGLDEDAIIGADVKGKVRLGDKMRRKKLYAAALIEYEKALKEEPENALILLKAARTNLILNNKDKAISQLRRAVESNPNYGTPHIELAKLEPPEKSLPLLLTANAINPFDPEIHRLLSATYQALGKTKKAEREKEITQSLTTN